MSFKETVARVYREHAATYAGEVSRAELIEGATASLLIEVRAGRLPIDEEAAIRAALMKADEADGKSADRIIAKAARGEVPLVAADLDVVVTLGGGMRKTFWLVTDADVSQMLEVRNRNYVKVRDSFREFRMDVAAIVPVLEKFGTFGAAYEAGGFPPVASTGLAAAS